MTGEKGASSWVFPRHWMMHGSFGQSKGSLVSWLLLGPWPIIVNRQHSLLLFCCKMCSNSSYFRTLPWAPLLDDRYQSHASWLAPLLTLTNNNCSCEHWGGAFLVSAAGWNQCGGLLLHIRVPQCWHHLWCGGQRPCWGVQRLWSEDFFSLKPSDQKWMAWFQLFLIGFMLLDLCLQERPWHLL